MSDCSTEGMKSKEPTRICGTCKHYSLIWGVCKQDKEDVRMPFGHEPCDKYGFDGFYPDGSWREAHEALEQRYQQLEQVAKEMLNCVFGHRYWPLRHKLEALGVSVDDD